MRTIGTMIAELEEAVEAQRAVNVDIEKYKLLMSVADEPQRRLLLEDFCRKYDLTEYLPLTSKEQK